MFRFMLLSKQIAKARRGLERRNRIEGRSHALFDSQRCSGEQELPSLQSSCHLRRFFEIQVIEYRNPEGDKREPVDRQSNAWRKSMRRDVVPRVMTDERHTAFLHEVRDIRLITSEAFAGFPRTKCRPAFPAPRVQENHVARRHFHALNLFESC